MASSASVLVLSAPQLAAGMGDNCLRVYVIGLLASDARTPSVSTNGVSLRPIGPALFRQSAPVEEFSGPMKTAEELAVIL